MHAGEDRLEFAPPPQPAAGRAFALAVLAHLLLMAALTWGINWTKETENVTAEAELWAAMPKEAVPPPPPPQAVAPPPPPVPVPTPRVETPPPPPVAKAPDITVEREKRRQELAEQKRLEQEQQKKLEARRQREELERDRKLEARRLQEEQRRLEVAEQKAALEKQRREAAAKDKATQQATEKKMAAQRADNLARMQRMAGSPDKGAATDSSSKPSSAYAARIAARIKPYIRHPQDVPGNPPVEIEVRTSPDGTIVGQRVVKSSGNPAWDESAIRAVIAATTLPRNEEGRVISPMIVVLRQREQ